MGFPAHKFQPKIPKVQRVQTVKNTLNKAAKSGKDLTIAMLCLRSTPIDLQLPSPTELLYQRKLKSNLPIRIENQMPNRDQISQRLMERQQSMKYYHDGNAQDLSPLATGQHVRIQDQRTKKWFPGTVSCKRPEPRSYEVQTQNGSTLRHNRCHLRPASTQHIEMGHTDENTVSASVRLTQTSMETTRSNANQSPEPYRTRSGCTKTRPANFAE